MLMAILYSLKEKEPHLSISIESPNCVKYICWTKKRDTSFVVLSNTGILYSGDLKQPLKQVMDDVDAGKFSLALFAVIYISDSLYV